MKVFYGGVFVSCMVVMVVSGRGKDGETSSVYASSQGVQQTYQSRVSYHKREDGTCFKRVEETINGIPSVKETTVDCEELKKKFAENDKKTQENLKKNQEKIENDRKKLEKKIRKDQNKIQDQINRDMKEFQSSW